MRIACSGRLSSYGLVVHLVCLAFTVVSANALDEAEPSTAYSEAWFRRFDGDLKSIFRYTSHFAWETSVHSNPELVAASNDFNTFKMNWINDKCEEMEPWNGFSNGTRKWLTIIDTIERKLCAGPKFTEHHLIALNKYFEQMQRIFSGTSVCLPASFDICSNLDHIWSFTYVRHPNGDVERLNLDEVTPKKIKNSRRSKLTVYDGSVFDPLNVVGRAIDASDANHLIRSSLLRCFDGENELEDIMCGDFAALNRSDCTLRYTEVLRWAWESWRAAVGRKVGDIYSHAISVMNIGAKNSGYANIGEVWREDIQMPQVSSRMNELLDRVRPFYWQLHGIVRRAIWKNVHTFEPFNERGTIPAHILGSMWSQNWQIHRRTLLPSNDFDLDASLRHANWSVVDMVKHVDDFYRSLGMPSMSATFWEKSVLSDGHAECKYHGTAANMFDGDDFRLIVCGKCSLRSFYVAAHEMGHLQYYMAYARQPAIFQNGAAALQESIGDAIFLGMMVPQHLNRLTLLPDDYLFGRKIISMPSALLETIYAIGRKSPTPIADELSAARNYLPKASASNQPMENHSDDIETNFDIAFLLSSALWKIPQIPFQYIMDVFRWELFNETVSVRNGNDLFWRMAMAEQGIHPPDWLNRHNYFDAGAKFHVVDNAPYAPYFLASFIQAQIFKGLCEVTVYGRVNVGKALPMPLHRCDIYGSKKAGKILKKALSLGTSLHWTEVLFILTGSRDVSADALLLYYEPLIGYLGKIERKFDISTGWLSDI